MNLRHLINTGLLHAATATVATPATDVALEEPSVATVATLARGLTDVSHAGTVAAVATVAVAVTEKPGIQWQTFLDECLLLDATPDEVIGMFGLQDKLDMCQEQVVKLPLHAQTIAKAIKRNRPPVAPDSNCTVYVINPVQVKCCNDCLYFNRIEHPHLGTCSAGEPEGIVGNWDTDPRNHCQSWKSC